MKAPIIHLKKFVRYARKNSSHIQARDKFTAPKSVQERQGGLMYRRIMMYQIMADILKSWLKSGAISKKEYNQMNTKIAEKYGISLSGIFVDNSAV